MNYIHTASGVLFVLGLVAIAFCTFMLARNQWVYRVRMETLIADYARYKRLPSYDHMMVRFWVWNVTAFLPSTDRR